MIRPAILRGILPALVLLAATGLRAQFSASKLALIDRPFIGEQLAISPDGRYLAYNQNTADRLLLYIADLERKVVRAMPLSVVTRPDRPVPRLSLLRWAEGNRLIVQQSDGQLAAIDPDGANPVQLWRPGDNGIVNDYQNMATTAIGGPPRVIFSPIDDPASLLVESTAMLGSERLANLFKVNLANGGIETANRRAYFVPDQIALYGRGNLILPPPPPGSELPPQNPESSSTGMMIYDRTGWPRLLYEMTPTKTRRRFSYTAQGKPPVEEFLVPVSFDEFLGQKTYREDILGRIGEFDVRAENYFGERSYPIAFDYDPNVVYIASNKGRDNFGIYSLNLTTRERVDLAPGVTAFDLAPGDPEEARDILVFDEAKRQLVGIRFTGLKKETYWIDTELRELQLAAEQALPRYSVEILSWDNERRRFALRASSESDPGGIFVYHRAEDSVEQIAARAPWLAETSLKPASAFGFETSKGVKLTGYITLPTEAKIDPPPLMLYLAPALWSRADPGFNREAEMLADQGIAVMRLNYRGSVGFGRAHVTALQEGIDTVPLEDLVAAVEWLAARRPIDKNRVVVMGEGFGGYLALRAVQTRPDIFRAAISVNAPTNLSAWARRRPIVASEAISFLEAAPTPAEDAAPEEGLIELEDTTVRTYSFRSVVREEFVRKARRERGDIAGDVASGSFQKPVLLISNPLSGDLTPVSSLLGIVGLGGLQGMSVDRMNISGDFVGGTLTTRSRVFQRIQEFLNVSLYNFGAEAENLREVSAPPAKQ